MASISRAEAHHPTAVVLVPTRELAKQVRNDLVDLGKARRRYILAVYGGVPYASQLSSLRRGAAVLVACPGRLLDLVERGAVSLDRVEVAVVDEADRMSDLGFLPEVVKLLDMMPADRQTLLYGAARGMVQALGDPNSVYETPRERELTSSRWTGRYEGVGMYVDQKDGEMVVTAPIEGGPAQKAGVQPGDVVLEVDGQSVGRLTLTEQTRLIRGPRGSTVTLTIRRAGLATPLRIPIVRDQVRIISARGRMLDSGLEYESTRADVFSITAGDPLSARAECRRSVSFQRGDWRVHVETASTLTADAKTFHLTNVLDAYEGAVRVFAKTWHLAVPRDLV